MAPNATLTHTVEPLPTAVEEIADLARRATDIQPAGYDINNDGERHLVVARIRNDESIQVLDLEKHRDNPLRTTGSALVYDPADFAEYVNRIANANHTSVWATESAGTITAVVNDHAHWDMPGWRDHTITLKLQDDPDWQRWHANDGKRVSQEDFAELVEDLAHTIIEPDAATMYEVATTFSAKRNVDFQQGTRLATGDVQLKFEETTSATAGVKGTMEFPEKIKVRIAPWLGVPPVDLDARLRYRIEHRQLRIGWLLLRSDIAKRDAFAQLVSTVRESLSEGLPIYLGTPPQPVRR